MTCYLLERSIKTLALRVERHNQNAAQIATQLKEQAAIKQVYYPGLESHPGHSIAAAQMTGFGGMLSFELDTAITEPHQFLQRLRLITPALSLGGVESIICAPCATSHAKLAPAERAEMGISDSLLRLSVGIEAPQDILADIRQALGECA
jgi:cystathionine beta-lyase